MKKILLIDAHSLIHRAFHALPPLTSPNGKPVGALYGIASTLIKMLQDIEPTHIAAAFDRPEPTFRKEEFEEYKAHRPPTPDELIDQFDMARELFEIFGIACFDKAGYEGDDILGTLVKKFKNEKDAIITILTGDLDTLQLVEGERIVVRTFGRRVSDVVVYDESAVISRFKVPPIRIPDYKGLVGDTSDNIPGVRGVGPKTAAELLSGGISLEDMFNNGLNNPRIQKIIESKETALLSKKLATIHQDVPLSVTIDEIAFNKTEPETLIAYFETLGFESIVKRIKNGSGIKQYTLNKKEEAHEIKRNDSLLYVGDGQKEIENNKTVVTFDWKRFLKTSNTNIQTVNVFDCGIAAWLINTDIARPTPEVLSKIFLQKTLLSNENETLLESTAFELYETLEEKIRTYKLTYVFNEIEMPLIEVLSHMEMNGIEIDVKQLKKLSGEISNELATLEKNIYSLAGGEFNINSPLQTGGILFDTLHLGTGRTKTTPKGQRKTNREVLESMKGAHPIIQSLLSYREGFKVLSGFVNPLITAVGSDGRVHTTFIQTGTTTGRLASENPNMQNIPHESRWALPIRKTFRSADGWSFASLDYSQLELRLLSHLVKSDKLIRAFNEGADIHALTASQIFNVPLNDVTPNLRRVGKTLNFGVIYGMGPRAFAQVSGVSLQEAKRFIENYYTTFPEVGLWQENIKEIAATVGYVTNIHGRRRSFEHARVGGKLRGDVERQAINMPIQSFGADIVKLAMKFIFNEIIKDGHWKENVRLLLSIHDELLFEIRDDILSDILPLLTTRMEDVCELSVPLRVDVRTGKNWGEMK